MAHYTVSFEVAADPTTVFAFVSDFANLPTWDLSVRAVEMTHDPGPALGRRYHALLGFYGKTLDADFEIDGYEAGSHLGYTVTGKADGRVDLNIAPSGAGSRVDYRIELVMRGLARLLDRGLAAALEGIVDNAERGLRKHLR